jgi:hypothetical protein
MLILFILLSSINTKELFAGAGIEVDIDTINHGWITMNCTTNEDCYDLLCSFWPGDEIFIKPFQWGGDCHQLKGIDKQLVGLIDVYLTHKIVYETAIHNVTQASQLFCVLSKHHVTQIQYMLTDLC